MRSAVVLGGAAWLLGAASATAASIYAVGQLGTGILSSSGPGSSVAAVTVTLPHVRGEPALGKSGPAGGAMVVRRGAGQPTRGGGRQSPASVELDVSNAAGDGAMAICQRGLAQLQAVTPAQGVATNNLQLGPAPMARVTFISQGSAVVLQVSCVGGKPSVQWLPLAPPPGGGQGGDE